MAMLLIVKNRINNSLSVYEERVELCDKKRPALGQQKYELKVCFLHLLTKAGSLLDHDDGLFQHYSKT